MTILVYLIAYGGTIACAAVIAFKVYSYLKKPVHVRWELYPVAHEAGDRPSYGGSYLEDVDWWKSRQKSSFIGSVKGLLIELMLLRSTQENNIKLWWRTYPFHMGLYLHLGGIGLAIFAALTKLAGIRPGIFLTAVGNIVQVVFCLGFLCIIGGAGALLHRRLTQPDLRIYSTREHYLNLSAFVALGVLGLISWLVNPSFFELASDFIANMLSFTFTPPDSGIFTLYLLFGFILAAYVPATHMGHFFMKYFLYHDIRWGDQPTQDNPNIQKKIGVALGYPVSWQAAHIQGDGKKTWAEVATTNPALSTDEKKEM